MLYSIITKDFLEILIFFSKTVVHIFTEMPIFNFGNFYFGSETLIRIF